MRILTWHVHGNYLWYLSQVPHEFWLVTDAARSPGHAGRSGTLPWGPNVHEIDAARVRDERFDVVLFQSRAAWDDEQHRILSDAQRRGPRLYLEHDPPQEHPTGTRHWVDDPQVPIVHCTHFNALMWDSGRSPVRVIEHGVRLLKPVPWRGERERGLVVVNNLDRRGRRLGADIYADVSRQVPLTLAGMGAQRLGGEGELRNDALPAHIAAHRFFFHPIRWTSLGLALIEAMMVGAPVVGLATTELAGVITNGRDGIIDTRVHVLVDAMRRLLADPAEAGIIGAAGRRLAQERFGIERFVADWQRVLREAVT